MQEIPLFWLNCTTFCLFWVRFDLELEDPKPFVVFVLDLSPFIFFSERFSKRLCRRKTGHFCEVYCVSAPTRSGVLHFIERFDSDLECPQMHDKAPSSTVFPASSDIQKRRIFGGRTCGRAQLPERAGA